MAYGCRYSERKVLKFAPSLPSRAISSIADLIKSSMREASHINEHTHTSWVWIHMIFKAVHCTGMDIKASLSAAAGGLSSIASYLCFKRPFMYRYSGCGSVVHQSGRLPLPHSKYAVGTRPRPRKKDLLGGSLGGTQALAFKRSIGTGAR